MRFGEVCLYGLIGCIGIFEIGHMAGVFMGYPVWACGRVVLYLLAVACIFLTVFLIVKRRVLFCEKRELRRTGKCYIPFVIFCLLLAAQIYHVFAGSMIQTAGDITLETVNSFLFTDRIYSVSPLTGEAYSGMPLRYKILCLPTIYALLCRWTGVMPEVIVGSIIPAVVICMSYIAYYLLGSVLFDEREDGGEKRWWFMVMLALIFFLCEKTVYMEGYGILHAGHLGTTIRNSILIPLVLYAALEKKWFLACLCILAEACIVWTFWGLGVCPVILAGVAVTDVLLKHRYFGKVFPGLADKEGNI